MGEKQIDRREKNTLLFSLVLFVAINRLSESLQMFNYDQA